MTETQFLSEYDSSAYEKPALTVDLVLLGILQGHPAVLLSKRAQHPHAGRWALPGGFVGIEETLDAAAERISRDKAGIEGAHLQQLYTFGAIDRDPRMRIVSVAYLALITETDVIQVLDGMPALSMAVIDAPWSDDTGGPISARSTDRRTGGETLPLAFDHESIIALAIQRLRGKLDYSDVAFALLPEQFTLRQLQDVHEAILGIPINKPAFRRRMLDRGWLEPTGAREAGTSFRPAELYRFQRPL